jgi:hypothetical protein
MDPQRPDDAVEILAEHLTEALGEDDTKQVKDDPVVFGVSLLGK